MRSMIGMRVKVLHDNKEMTGMISSIKGEDILITLSPAENITAPLDDCEIYKASEDDLKEGIELIVEW